MPISRVLALTGSSLIVIGCLFPWTHGGTHCFLLGHESGEVYFYGVGA